MKYAFIPLRCNTDDHRKFLKECDPNYRTVKVEAAASTMFTTLDLGSEFFSYYAVEAELSDEDLMVFKLRFPYTDNTPEFKLINDYKVTGKVSKNFKW